MAVPVFRSGWTSSECYDSVLRDITVYWKVSDSLIFIQNMKRKSLTLKITIHLVISSLSFLLLKNKLLRVCFEFFRKYQENFKMDN